METAFADLSRLERDLHLPVGFLAQLVEEDDWSFIIKSYAIIEAALGNMIGAVSDSRLTEFFGRLPFEGKHGKTALAKQLGALDGPTIDFIRRLANLRNRLVHDTTLLAFDLPSYVAALPANERADLAEMIAHVITGASEEEQVVLVVEGLRSQAKITMVLAVSAALARILFRIDPDEYERAVAAAREGMPKLMLLTFVVVLIGALSRTGGDSTTAQQTRLC